MDEVMIMLYNELYNDGLPLGFGMVLASNVVAMNRFSNLSQREREELIARTHGLQSHEEMQNFVAEFGKNGLGIM